MSEYDFMYPHQLFPLQNLATQTSTHSSMSKAFLMMNVYTTGEKEYKILSNSNPASKDFTKSYWVKLDEASADSFVHAREILISRLQKTLQNEMSQK